MTKYFRITGYYPKEGISFIMDSNGRFEKLWQFSAFVVSKGCKILEVGTDETFIDINIEKAEETFDKIVLQAWSQGKPRNSIFKLGDNQYFTIKIGEKSYIPDKMNLINEI